MSKETDARIIIDRLLREAGWDIEHKSQVSTEEPAADGRADYLLKDSRTRPHEPPEQILEVIAEKQERIAELIGEIRILFENNHQGK